MHPVGFTIEIYYDARFYKCQKTNSVCPSHYFLMMELKEVSKTVDFCSELRQQIAQECFIEGTHSILPL